MNLWSWALLAAALLGAAALASLWSAGRFAARRRGKPAQALAPGQGATLDLLLIPLEAAHPEASAAALIDAPVEALAARLALARLAERSLDLLYYIWEDDLSGRLLAEALLQAADRGVRVRLLLDDVNVLGRDPVYRSLDRHPRIEVRLFNPIRNRDRGLRRGLEILVSLMPYNRRMHGKLWISDGRLAISGGRNIGDSYFDLLAAGQGANYIDLDTLLAGPVLRDAEALFDRFWNSDLALPIRHLWLGRSTRLSRFRTRLSRGLNHPDQRARLAALALPPPEDDLAALRLVALHWGGAVTLLGDPPQKALGTRRDGWMPGALLPILRSAKTDLCILTPYFVPGAQGLRELLALSRAGVRVTVITNGLALADNVLVHGAYRWYRKRLLAEGVRIHEVAPVDGPARMLHSKAFVVDGTSAFVGSFNFDLRSAFLNTELGVVLDDPALVAGIEGIVAHICAPANAYAVTMKGRLPLWSRGSMAHSQIEPDSNALKRAVSFVIGHLPIHRFL